MQEFPHYKIHLSSLFNSDSTLSSWGEFCIASENNCIMKNIGIAVIVIGILMTVFTGFNIITKKKVLDVGSVEINREEKTPIYWSPVTGLVLIGVGGILIFAGRKK